MRRTLFVACALVAAACSRDSIAPPEKQVGGANTQNAPAEDPRRVIKEIAVKALAPGVVITIDGKLDEPAWAKAADTGPFVDVSSGAPNPRIPVQGSARLLWDDQFLYVGFDVKDSTIRGGFPTDAPDPHLWERDTVEVMIDPDGDGDNKDYYEIQVNPQNLVFDSQFDDYNRPRGGNAGPFGHQDWSAGLESAVVLRGTIDADGDKDEGYTVEAKIPWKSFAKAKASPPAPGDTWRMNFYAMQNNGGVAWSPILGMGNFHKAARFGRVKWVRE
ncbi:carbohydrate-binding family 9-like protein [Polyangium sp. 15x6]|uniref:carbohydrate-binding family 9-like protein n=1 Tax=Polyangium sp. 15x6 TaxID=3042687 RepID=UPI00249AFA51|nr:carbohydrate-binding family 9-like protein [Polyangium sp. 15x6]MDI3284969.1 carbohydrate-binding family 9-like protein [Polyangium sp. 15x6]